MKAYGKAVVAMVVLALLANASAVYGQAGEFRGMWVSRFEWPHPDPAQCKARIDEIMQTLAAHNFNAVVFQVRGQCDTLYPSPEEPWSPFISPSGADPGWDPMAYAIEAAHANKLEFHAYINTHVAWQSSRKQPPVVPTHVFFKHFNGENPDACDWLVHDADGKPITWGGDNYVWIAPGVPEAQAYTRRQVMYVVKNYNVDGIHFDRIRTPTPDVSHDPISKARMQPNAPGNPDNLDFAAWTADQFTRFCRDIYAEIIEAKPHVKVSSAPLGLVSRDRYPEYPAGFHYGLTKCHQDAQAWLAAGAMDFVVPQIYWADNDNKPPDFSRLLPDWIAHAAGRHIYAGHATMVGVDELLRQVEATRRGGGLGNVVFSYRSFKSKKGFERYSEPNGVYVAPVATPAMTWKDAPQEGIIIGRVTDARTSEPIVDAQIRGPAGSYVALSSGDGLYSFLKVAPGSYTLTVSKAGLPEGRIENIDVVAGKVVRADIALGETPVVIAAAEQSGTEHGDAVETGGSGPTARQIETTVVTVGERPAWLCWLLTGLIMAGVILAGVLIAAYVSVRRRSAE